MQADLYHGLSRSARRQGNCRSGVRRTPGRNSRKELQVDRAVHADERRLQNRDLQQPGIALRGLHREAAASAAVSDKGADHFFRRRPDEAPATPPTSAATSAA
jgi:hypothetical protein